MKARSNLEILGRDERITLKRMFKNRIGAWTRLTRLKIGTMGRV
jgi:hypothetical protein